MPSVVAAYHETILRLGEHTARTTASMFAGLATWDEAASVLYDQQARPLVTAAAQAAVDTAAGLAYHYDPTTTAAASDLAVADAAARTFDPFDRLARLLANGATFEDALTGATSAAEALGRDAAVRTARQTLGELLPGHTAWQRRLTGKSCQWCMKLSSTIFTSAAQATFGHDNCDCVAVPADLIGDHNTTVRSEAGFDPAAEKLFDQRKYRSNLRRSTRTAQKRSAEARQELLTETNPLRRERLSQREQDWETRAERSAERLRILETGSHQLA